IGIIIPSTIGFYFFHEKAMIFLLTCSAVYIYFKNRIIGVVSILISFFILYIANFIPTWLATLTYALIKLNFVFNSLYLLVFAAITLAFSFITRYFIRKLLSSDLSFNKIYLTIVAIFLLTGLIILNVYLPNRIMSFADIKFLAVMYAVFIITIAILIIT
ncbi:ATP-binding protein, partial [Staphylococcus succinus]